MPRYSSAIVALLITAAVPLSAAAQVQVQVPPPERLCDPQFEDCREPVLELIRNEQMGIDVGFWYMQDARYANELVKRWQAGVPIRILVDSRADKTYPGNPIQLATLADAGIPMREKFGEDILHNKMMLFHGQNMVEFSKANYDPYAYVPQVPDSNYEDEAVYFTDDDRITNSFRRRFDDRWIDTSLFRNYANITAPLARNYPLYSIDPTMNFSSGSGDFSARVISRMDQETQSIDAIVFRVTEDRMADAVIRAVARGVPVRLITEPGEYRNPKRIYDSKEVDRMYMGGADIRWRAHEGLTHEALIVLHQLGEVIFGSANWTLASAVYQDEHNFFYNPSFGKPWFFDWFVEQFEGKWTHPSNFVPFTPLPPDAPIYSSPSNGASGLGTSVTLTWDGGPWSHKYDVYFGTTSNPPLVAGNVVLGSPDPGVIETYTASNLQPGTTYYWRIVDRTYADMTSPGAVWTFTTGGTPNGSVGNTPFRGTPWPVPGTIQAEDYDDGGQSVAYFDTAAGNKGGVYRTDDVDIQATSDADGAYNVGWTKAGEWLKYTVAVGTTATYQLEMRVAQLGTGTTFHVEVDSVDKTGRIAVPDTGGWQTFTTLTIPGISMTAGAHVVRLVFDTEATGGAGNYNWFRFSAANEPPVGGGGGGSTPFRGTPWPVPGTIQAEDYDNNGQSVAYFDTSAGNKGGVYRTDDVDIQTTSDADGAYNLGWTKAGEWLKYTVAVNATDNYDLEVRVAQLGTGTTFHVEVDTVDKTGRIAVPDTGGWQVFKTLTIPGVSMTAGTHVVRLVFDTAASGGAGNYNWLRFSTGDTPTTPTANLAWQGTPAPLPGIVHASNFDTGGDGVSYHDTSAGNSGGQYRTDTAVDIATNSDPASNGFYLGWARVGEWVKYTVNAQQSRTYAASLRVANLGSGATFRLEVDGTAVTGNIALPNTGAWTAWATLSLGGISLSQGQHVIRIVMVTSNVENNGVGNYGFLQFQ